MPMTHRLPTDLLAQLLQRLFLSVLMLLAPVLAHAQLSEAQRDYVLGAGDVVRVSVYQNQDLTLETRITESGAISYPLLGQVRLGGLSVPQAEKLIADGLKNGNFVRQPQVSILVTQVRGNQASVLGMVNRPGRYPIEQTGMRLSELLATAGGIAQGGSDQVVLSGMRDSKPLRVVIDVPLLFAQSGGVNDPVIANGDTVYVERMPMVYIYGEVQRPGAMRLERDMTVLQGLASGGGLTQRGTEKGLRLHRRGADGKVQILQPGMNDPLQNGDVIYLRESLF
ncbi:polysaccharide export protein EpsE [Sphaerotilus natans subsp. natans DSM 6575]|uniref:Polysaccharide export protein EpsE n=2 Tax=Sphaerotilus natans TaxID=34103 RepID=A0A059KIS9_9BURK|nr:polysaccharide export protein EpsE [Sphaerotilus natans subsp. natans DSM 6575]SIR55954.1 polysaccharide export outer membrane protein [Sphaerotilus natans]